VRRTWRLRLRDDGSHVASLLLSIDANGRRATDGECGAELI
jgi:hypothetical protein